MKLRNADSNVNAIYSAVGLSVPLQNKAETNDKHINLHQMPAEVRGGNNHLQAFEPKPVVMMVNSENRDVGQTEHARMCLPMKRLHQVQSGDRHWHKGHQPEPFLEPVFTIVTCTPINWRERITSIISGNDVTAGSVIEKLLVNDL
jgi:hypothetical protein